VTANGRASEGEPQIRAGRAKFDFSPRVRLIRRMRMRRLTLKPALRLSRPAL
jgi:hypothetical protein